MENPRTKRVAFLQQAITAITALLELHQKVSACYEKNRTFTSYSDDTIWGLPVGYAGKGLTLLSGQMETRVGSIIFATKKGCNHKKIYCAYFSPPGYLIFLN
jgi:adenylyl- and sulfurtransferase ThiI